MLSFAERRTRSAKLFEPASSVYIAEVTTHSETTSAPPSAPANETGKARRRRPEILLLPLLPLLVVGALWGLTDLGSFKSPQRLAEAASMLRESPLALLYVLLAFALGTLLFIPITALIAGTTLAFDPLRGFGYALLGALLAASITYWAGRWFGGGALDYVSGPKLAKFRNELRARAFRASIVARFMPVGSFTLINMVAGSMRIPFRAYFFGNLIGLLPGVLALTLFADRIGAALRSPDRTNLALLAAALVLVVGLSFVIKRRVRRQARQGEAGGELSS